IQKAHEAIDNIDLSETERYLDPDYSVQTAVNWLREKFGIELPLEEAKSLSSSQLIETAHQRVQLAYDLRECEYPVIAGLYRFMSPTASASGLGRDDLVEWAQRRFGAPLSADDLKNKQREEIQQVLVACSQQ